MKLEIDQTFISYHEIGEGRPLLAIHGWLTDHQYIMKILEPAFEKRQGWKRIYIDLPGRGQSPGSDRIKSSHDELTLLLKFIQARLNGKRFTLVGLSYGGFLARGVLKQQMEAIDGLALIVPSIEADPSHRQGRPPRSVLVRDETAIQDLQPGEMDGVFEKSLVLQDKPALDRLRKRFFPSVEMTDRVFLEKLSENYGFPFDVDDLPQPFRRPALFLLGRQDHIVGYHSALDLMGRYPRATFAILDAAGHFLGGIEQVALSRVLIGDWLDRVEAHATSAGQ
ncbi:MAG TPA: alpha/beta hydrolase [Anaerolineales bacterium]